MHLKIAPNEMIDHDLVDNRELETKFTPPQTSRLDFSVSRNSGEIICLWQAKRPVVNPQVAKSHRLAILVI